jgi:hypothetical protein
MQSVGHAVCVLSMLYADNLCCILTQARSDSGVASDT